VPGDNLAGAQRYSAYVYCRWSFSRDKDDGGSLWRILHMQDVGKIFVGTLHPNPREVDARQLGMKLTTPSDDTIDTKGPDRCMKGVRIVVCTKGTESHIGPSPAVPVTSEA
jgi:hypothetical protein